MECNKDDANKAKEIAERKLTEKDFAGAKKFALKAQSLYPGIEGLSQLMMTIDVYVSGEKKVNGEVDWYGVLDVSPFADDETVKKQYRKLALMLHPDKNKCAGADGAFKLLSEAWSLLHDKAKRIAYNKKRNLTNKLSSNVRPPNTVPRGNPTSVPRPSVPKSNSFWTTCGTCQTHYEYLRIYLNNTIFCSHCRQAFKAVETTVTPPKYSMQSKSTAYQRHQKPAPTSNFTKPPFPYQSNHMPGAATVPNTGLGGSCNVKFQNGNTADVGPTVSSSSIGSKAAYVIHQANERMKRAREDAQPAGGWEKRRGEDGNLNGYVGIRPPQMATGSKVYDFTGTKYAMSTRELTPLETRNMLTKKVLSDIRKKLSEWSSEAKAKPQSTSISKTVESKKVNQSDLKQKNVVKPDNHKSKKAVSVDSKKVNQSDLKQKNVVKPDNHKSKNAVSNSPVGGNQVKESSTKTSIDAKNDDAEINVPDPDFYDFDNDRMESSFEENQVWAAYDDDDGMPRFYAKIHKVISLKPFKMRISWLESKTNIEFSKMKWVGCGFAKSCGEFRLGKPEFTKSLNTFSHKVKFVKGSTGSIHILPKKGEVWALYRNWSRDWTELTPDEVIHKYDMVEVLEDYNEDQGISIAPLIKVSDFRTVFRTSTDAEHKQTVRKEEMLRFSHQIPNHFLTGEEAKNAPKGLQELDPASTPLEFLQVVTEANEKDVEGIEKYKGDHMTE